MVYTFLRSSMVTGPPVQVGIPIDTKEQCDLDVGLDCDSPHEHCGRFLAEFPVTISANGGRIR